jgi:hypothetical protein
MGSSDNQVNGNYIGIIPDGGKGLVAQYGYGDGVYPSVTRIGNGGDGIYVTGDDNLIGGSLAGAKLVNNDPLLGNFISANLQNGIEIAGGNNNKVYGNYIGTTISGDDVYDANGWYTGNLRHGVYIRGGGTGNLIGDTGASKNVISGNVLNGVRIWTSDSNYIRNNIIGADATGKKPLTNGGNAVDLNTVNAAEIAGNLIYRDGTVRAINLTNCQNDKIKGKNTTKLASAPFPGMVPAILVAYSTAITIGGPDDGDGNTIDTGIELVADDQIVIQRNLIGTDANGTNFGNLCAGISIDLASTNITIGGPAAGQGNVIAFNADGGIRDYGTTVSIVNNTIDATNNKAIVAEFRGDLLIAANVLGEVDLLMETNVVSQGNLIGVNASGVTLGNSGDGIDTDPSSTNVVIQGNVIAYNGGIGIHVIGTTLPIIDNTVVQSGIDVQLDGGIVDLTANTLGWIVIGGGTTATFHGATTATRLTVTGGTTTLAGSGDTLDVNGPASMEGGSITLPAGTTMTVTGTFQQNGQVYLLDGNLRVYGGLNIGDVGTLWGSGEITADVTNSGFFYVGNIGAIGTIHIAADAAHGVLGNFTQTSLGSLEMEIAGPAAVDLLAIDGAGSLGGNLTVALLNGFIPTDGEVFTLITAGGGLTGTFDYIYANDPGGWLEPLYGPNTFSLLAHSW